MYNKQDMWCVEWNCDEGKLQHVYFRTEEEARKHETIVKPIAFFGPSTVEVYEVQLTTTTQSTTDFNEYTECPWTHDWGKLIWWNGVDNPTHLRKQRTLND